MESDEYIYHLKVMDILEKFPASKDDPVLFSQHAQRESLEIARHVHQCLMDIYEKYQEERSNEEGYEQIH